jgi:phosphohistidine swiveling domain-containing protein
MKKWSKKILTRQDRDCYNQSSQLIQHLGGKGERLALLERLGLLVPQWLGISTAVFEEALAPFILEIRKMIDEGKFLYGEKRCGHKECIHFLCKEIQTIIGSVPLSEELKKSLHSFTSGFPPTTLFAVRSSALGEDSTSHSFAGLFDTQLFVSREALEISIRQVWASCVGERALMYIVKKNDNERGLFPLEKIPQPMGVIVQEMVMGDRSGVLFSANPMGPLQQVVITAAYGIGEGIVSGMADVDTYYWDRFDEHLSSNIEHKKNMVLMNREQGRGTKQGTVPDHLANQSVLTPDEIKKLVIIALQLEREFKGRHQDIEWVFAGDDGPYLMQSRDITTIPYGILYPYDNSNIVESYPGIVSPLSFSICRYLYQRNFETTALMLGIPKKMIQANSALFRDMMEHIKGRVYYNLRSWYQIYSLVETLGPILIPMFNEMVGIKNWGDGDGKGINNGEGGKISKVPIFRKFYNLGRLLPLAFQSIRKLILNQRNMQFYESCFKKLYLHYRQIPIENVNLSPLEIYQLWDEFIEKLIPLKNYPLSNDFFLMVIFSVMRKSLAFCGMDEANNVANGMFCGIEGMASLAPLISLKNLVIKLQSQPHLLLILQKTQFPTDSQGFFEKLKKICDLGNALSFYRQFVAHLENFGDRSLEELKLESLTFADNPNLFLQLVLQTTINHQMQSMDKYREEMIREEAWNKIRPHLSGRPHLRLWLILLSSLLKNLLKNREKGRIDRAYSVGIYRKFIRQLQRRLVEDRLIDQPGDIFYLKREEIGHFLHSKVPAKDWKELIRARRMEEEDYQKFDPPHRIYLKRGGVGFVPNKSRVERGDGFLKGQGCAPGRIEGEALVVRDPRQAIGISNKILVAEMTDPGWVFLMCNSLGLIVERGGTLSHTAIIGRELGIPTIVGVDHACQRIKTGQRIILDANSGLIEVLPDPVNTSSPADLE